ncbi:MAG: hypothetical protein ABR987_16530 [Terracidiphilus sp.]
MFSSVPKWGDSRQRQLDRLIESAKRETEREYEAIRKVGAAIIQASVNNRDEAKKWIEAPTEAKRLERESFVFFEFIYFYTHVTMRHAVTMLTASQKQKILEYLENLIPSVAIDSYFAHWPSNLKEKMKNEFVEKQCDAEVEYTELVRTSNSSDGLLKSFFLLACHISDLCGCEAKAPEARKTFVDLAIEEWTKMDIDSLMAGVNSVS